MKTIEITVDPKGNSHVQTKGFAGAGCLEASEFIELALSKRNDVRKTAEFFSSSQVENNLQNENGS